jgi:hypothetical protein
LRKSRNRPEPATNATAQKSEHAQQIISTGNADQSYNSQIGRSRQPSISATMTICLVSHLARADLDGLTKHAVRAWTAIRPSSR